MNEKNFQAKSWKIARAKMGTLLLFVLMISGLVACIGVIMGVLGSSPAPMLLRVVIGVALSVLILIFCLRMTVYIPSVVVEDRKLKPGLKRSYQLTKKHFWRILAFSILIYVVVLFLQMILFVSMHYVAMLSLVPQVISMLLISYAMCVPTLIIISSFQMLLFVDLRARQDNVENQLEQAVIP